MHTSIEMETWKSSFSAFGADAAAAAGYGEGTERFLTHALHVSS